MKDHGTRRLRSNSLNVDQHRRSSRSSETKENRRLSVTEVTPKPASTQNVVSPRVDGKEKQSLIDIQGTVERFVHTLFSFSIITFICFTSHGEQDEAYINSLRWLMLWDSNQHVSCPLYHYDTDGDTLLISTEL